MNWKKTLFVCLIVFVWTLPSKVFAVDFEIEDATIDAYLQADGTINVIEVFTYDLTSEFNGITRELVAKKGASIEQFSAKESGKTLTVEKEANVYKVFRKGNNETISVELQYQIINGVEKYEDGAQFYWPFFDKRNESDYKNMTITIHPPEAAQKVDFLGYDSAYETGKLNEDNSVSFLMGYVPAGKNGDIRVVYEPTLFPNIVANKGTIRDQLHADIHRLANEKKTFMKNRQKTNQYGVIGLAGMSALLIGIFSWMITFRKRQKRITYEQLSDDRLIVPDEKMSMPATIYFTNGNLLTPEVTAAALLDLIRNGYVKQLSEDHFQLIDRNVIYSHEEALIELLFDKIGDGVHFYITDLETYTKNNNNHTSYSHALTSWRNGIVNEVKQSGMYENKGRIRLFLLLISIVLGVSVIPFARYEQYVLMTFTIVLSVVAICVAIFYKPRSIAGHTVIEEWKLFLNKMDDLDQKEWANLSAIDKFRAYTYEVGMKSENVESQFTEFTDAQRRTDRVATQTQYFHPVFISNSFHEANNNASVDSGGTSTASSSGGGVGGGGGGSGAF